MAIKTKQEVLEGLKKFIPDEDTSDDTLTFLKDVADTLDAGADGAAWKQRAEDVEKEWKQKYKDAFYNPPDSESDSDPEPKHRSYADLFKTE